MANGEIKIFFWLVICCSCVCPHWTLTHIIPTNDYSWTSSKYIVIRLSYWLYSVSSRSRTEFSTRAGLIQDDALHQKISTHYSVTYGEDCSTAEFELGVRPSWTDLARRRWTYPVIPWRANEVFKSDVKREYECGYCGTQKVAQLKTYISLRKVHIKCKASCDGLRNYHCHHVDFLDVLVRVICIGQSPFCMLNVALLFVK